MSTPPKHRGDAAPRWEIVARWTMRDGATWIVPASVGVRPRWSRVGAWLEAKILTRHHARKHADQVKAGDRPTLPPFTFEHRRR